MILVFSSNELDFLILQNGKDGVSADSKYTWVKYSKNADGSDLTDDPIGAIYIGFAYNMDSPEESEDPNDYSWTKIKGDAGENGSDAYTIILGNENISFSVGYDSNAAFSNQSYSSTVQILQGVEERMDFTIGEISSANGIAVTKNDQDKTIVLSVKKGDIITADSGYFRIPINIDGLVFFKDLTWSLSKQGEPGEQGEPGQAGEGAVNVVVANESQTIACTNDGLVSENVLINIPFVAFKGLGKVPCSAVVGVLPSGITLGSNTSATVDEDGLIVLNVAAKSNLGGTNILSGYVNLTFSVENQTILKRFIWTKTKDGKDGNTYSLELSSVIVNKNYDGTISPQSITLNAYYQNGNERAPYEGRFIIAQSVRDDMYLIDENNNLLVDENNNLLFVSGSENSIFENVYVSSKNESTYTYALPDSISGLVCYLCKSDSVTNILDQQTVTVLNYIDDIKPIITEITTTMSGVSQKVDAVEKTITNKVWQSDITEAINNYDGTTIKTINDKVSEHTMTLEEISSQVSEIETEITQLPDGTVIQELTEKISELEQSADGFKQTVEKNYVTNDKLNETSEAIKSEFEQTAESISQTVTDIEGNISNHTQSINEISQTIADMDGHISEIEQSSQELELSVGKKQDIIPSGIRYIRDWLCGNSVDSENRWVDIQVIVNDTNLASGELNIAKGLTPTSDISVQDISNYTDDNLETYVSSSESGWHYIQLDLGEENIFDNGTITVWHYYTDNRQYQHKLEISSDGDNWFVLYDSKKNGMYHETSDGQTYYIRDDLLKKEMSFIQMDLDHITAQVQENANNFSAINVEVDGITQRVESVESVTQDIQNAQLPELEEQLTQQISEIKTNSDSIILSVSQIQDQVTQQAQQIIDANGWKVSLANIGAYDSSYATQMVNMSLTSDGLTISRSASEGYRTQMTGDTIKIEYDDGRGNFESVMSIDRDLMYLTRIKVKNGIDHYSIKELPIQYDFDGTIVKCLAFISSSGNS